MSEQDRSPPGKVWMRLPLRNHNSLMITIPAAIRRALHWHQNAPFLVSLEDGYMKVTQLDTLKAAGVPLPAKKLARRKKSWKSPPVADNRRDLGLLVEQEES